MTDKVDERSDDQQSDDLSLSIPLPPTPASVYAIWSILNLYQACWTLLLCSALGPSYFVQVCGKNGRRLVT